MPRSLVGLTGGIAAGKSETLRAFERQGAATISTDTVVHELQRSPEMVGRMVDRWGEEVAPSGELDRGKVAEIVFSDPAELEWLESEIHPLVGGRIVEWIGHLPDETRLAVVEVPLLFESGMEQMFDATVAVIADDEQRREREEGRDLAALEGRTGRQLSQTEKAERATHVIVNDGSLEELEARVAELVEELGSEQDAGDE
jgi:dephospho-CoA kinase